jgi:hypothetical protein
MPIFFLLRAQMIDLRNIHGFQWEKLQTTEYTQFGKTQFEKEVH